MIKSEENKLTWEGSKSENEDEKVDDRGNNKEARESLGTAKRVSSTFLSFVTGYEQMLDRTTQGTEK